MDASCDIDAFEEVIRPLRRVVPSDRLLSVPNTDGEFDELISEACQLTGNYNQGAAVLT